MVALPASPLRYLFKVLEGQLSGRTVQINTIIGSLCSSPTIVVSVELRQMKVLWPLQPTHECYREWKRVFSCINTNLSL